MANLLNPLEQPSPERTHPLMSTPVLMYDGSTLPADILAKRLHASPYGVTMREQQPLRFAQRHDYGTRKMKLTDHGQDLCPIGHQVELGYHVAQLIERQQAADPTFALTLEELSILMLSCQIHDMGESVHEEITHVVGRVIGDVVTGLKTEEDRIDEANIRWFLYDTELYDVAPHIIERVEAIISHQDTSRLHEMFNAAHEAQSLETMLSARDISDSLGWYEHGEAMQLVDNSNGRASAVYGMGRMALRDRLPTFESHSGYTYMEELLAKVDFPTEAIAA